MYREAVPYVIALLRLETCMCMVEGAQNHTDEHGDPTGDSGTSPNLTTPQPCGGGGPRIQEKMRKPDSGRPTSVIRYEYVLPTDRRLRLRLRVGGVSVACARRHFRLRKAAGRKRL